MVKAGSGGGKSKNSLGKRSLLGANAGIRISLGEECIGEARLYVTAMIEVKLARWNRSSGATVAREIEYAVSEE